jgi:hypothetical protein
MLKHLGFLLFAILVSTIVGSVLGILTQSPLVAFFSAFVISMCIIGFKNTN